MVINPIIGHYIPSTKKSNYVPNNGAESYNVYANALGFMRTDGIIPSNGVCYEINNNLVAFDENTKNININGFKILGSSKPLANDNPINLDWLKGQLAFGYDPNWPSIANPDEVLKINTLGNGVVGIPKNQSKSMDTLFWALISSDRSY